MLVVTTTVPVQAAGPYTAQQAAAHVGEAATVCGTVAAVGSFSGRNSPEILYFDQVFPNHAFSVRYAEADRAKLGVPGKPFGKQVCATGTIALYRGKPEIMVTQASQLRFK